MSSDLQDQGPLDPRVLRSLRRGARLAGAAVVLVAAFVLLGWVLSVDWLRSFAPGLTVVAFLFAGAALWFQASPHVLQGQPHPGRWLAGVTVLLALYGLSHLLLGWEAGPQVRTPPGSALGLLLIGMAIVSLDRQTLRGQRPAQWLALTTGLISLFTVIDCACSAAALTAEPSHIPMPLNSALTLGVLAVGALVARPDAGLMATVSSREIGGVVARRLVPAAILLPAALAWLRWLGERQSWFDPMSGLSLFVLATMILFTTLAWWTAASLNRIEADRSRAQKELQQKTAILELVLRSMGDGVVVADAKGQFLIFNPVAERIVGLGAIDAPPEEWTTHYGLFSPETGEPLPTDQVPLVRAIRGEATDQVELLIRSPRVPEGVYVTVTGRPLRGERGIEGGVVVFQDTTQRRKAARAIQQAKDEADAANRAKSEFLANMSHEIRTPMTAVIGMTELALETELNEVQAGYLKIVKDSAESLLSLINDILDFSKIEAGKLELDDAPFRLRDLLGDALRTLALRASSREIELACHIPPTVPEHLVGDARRLRQVVTNLVGNALKFTERGEVVLDVAEEPAPDGRICLHMAVRDTGIGIPHEKLHLLFNAFSQVDSSTTRRYGGTGLGLAITARLVGLMNGRTWVESEPGRGSTFHFTAQFARDPSPPPVASSNLTEGLPVLIVDDNSTSRSILEEVLAAWGMRPVAVESAGEGLDALCRARQRGEPIPLVISDVRMPDGDGFELWSRIRGDGHLQSTVILMLNSGSAREDVARCRSLGAAHVFKPIKQSELFDAIAAALGSPRPSNGSLPAQAAEPVRPLRILLVEDSDANRKLAVGVLSKWGHDLTVAHNGREAVSAWERARFDVILMDVQMPEMDGYQATALIRERERSLGGHIPIVAMTAHAMKGDREECLAAGMDDYVTKPIRWPDLRRALTGVPLQETGASPPPASVNAAALNWAEALKAVDGDDQLLHDVLADLLSEWPALIEQLDRAVSSQDSALLRRAAHTLAGSLRMFGSTTAGRLAREMETLATAGRCPDADLLQAFRTEAGDVLAAVRSRIESVAKSASEG